VDIFERAARQHGVISRGQLERSGTTRSRRRTLVAQGALVESLPGVFRIAGAPETWEQRAMAATLWLPGSLVSHRAAASLSGLRGFDRAPVELVTDRWARRSGHPRLVIHESTDLRAVDRSQRAGYRPPRWCVP
jgi:hypothetical protein